MCNPEAEVEILFRGGEMAVGGGTGTLESGEWVSCVIFQQLTEVQPIGGETKGLERSGLLVRMIFTKAGSIDVVIGQLERARDRLRAHAHEAPTP